MSQSTEPTPKETRAARGKKTPSRPRREWRIKKLARLFAYVTVVSAGVGLLAARSAWSDVKDSGLSLGHELGKMGDVGSKRPLRLNGEPIFVASTTEDMPLHEVLDTAEERCRLDTAGMAREFENLSEAVKTRLPAHLQEGSRRFGVVREERTSRGMVACLARPEGEAKDGIAELSARLADFADSGDLSKLGHLRYIYAETTSSGRTHVVAAWTDGPFNIYHLAPPQGGDAPGNDAREAPRPPKATRLLTADVEGVPYGVRIYDSSSSPDEVIALYDAEMAGRGWKPLYGVPGDGTSQRAFTRPGVDLMIFAQPDSGRTTVSVIEMRSQ